MKFECAPNGILICDIWNLKSAIDDDAAKFTEAVRFSRSVTLWGTLPRCRMYNGRHLECGLTDFGECHYFY